MWSTSNNVSTANTRILVGDLEHFEIGFLCDLHTLSLIKSNGNFHDFLCSNSELILYIQLNVACESIIVSL
jgi:hypothetical protein